MNKKPLSDRRGGAGWSAGLMLSLLLLASAGLAAQRGRQLYYNQDCTDFFYSSDIPEGEAGQMIDRYVDEIAGAGVTVFLCNSNARRTNYRSQVWDAFWDGYDPAGPDDQPFLAPIPRPQVAAYRKGVGNMLRVHQEGVDYPARMIQRCRKRGMEPWITLRMNDCHENDIPAHPFHGSFWIKNPQLRRQNCSGYFATCLDYARPEVRDYYLSLIQETLERYNIDGLELDFMREPYVFSADKEKEGAPILTGWLREVRKQVAEAAARRGHSIRLGMRVPSRPETALAMGLDAVSWAKEGLIDVLVVTPRWATLEFGLPIPEWRQMLGKTKTSLVGGLEILYRPMPGGPAENVSPELALGAASLVLADGADAVYLFNYFPGSLPKPVYQSTLRAMTSLDSLQELPRRVGVTYRDITASGEAYRPPLPATGKEAIFNMKLGPMPTKGWRHDVVIGLASGPGTPQSAPSVLFDGTPCEFRELNQVKDGRCRTSSRIPLRAITKNPTHEIKVTSKDQTPLTIQQVEVLFTPQGKGKP